MDTFFLGGRFEFRSVSNFCLSVDVALVAKGSVARTRAWERGAAISVTRIRNLGDGTRRTAPGGSCLGMVENVSHEKSVYEFVCRWNLIIVIPNLDFKKIQSS